MTDNGQESKNGFTMFVNEKGQGALIDKQTGLTLSPSMRGEDPFAVTDEFLTFLDTIVVLHERLEINQEVVHRSFRQDPVQQVKDVEVPDNPRPSNVSDINANRPPQQAQGSPDAQSEMRTTVIAIERVANSKGDKFGYKLYREADNGQRQSVGSVWLERLTKQLEEMASKDLKALDIGDVTSVRPITAFYKKGNQTSQGGFYNDFLRFEAAS